MICKSCGTECRGAYCSHCGAPLVNEAFAAPPAPASLGDGVKNQALLPTETGAVSTSTTSTKKGEDIAQQQLSKADKKRVERKAKGARCTPKIKMRQIFFPSLMLLLPLFYLFVDVFVLYSDVLYTQNGNTNVLGALVARLTQAEFASNPVSDLIVSTLGGSTTLLEALRVKDILGAADLYRPYVLPAALLAALSILSAFCGLAVLFSKGRILCVRFLADTVITVGFAAVVAPFLGGALFFIPHLLSGGMTGADAAMRLFGFSIEAWLLCGLSFALMLPAVRSLRRTAAGGGIYLTAPYRLFGKKIGASRFFGVIAALLATVCSGAILILEISPNGALLSTFLNQMGSIWQNFLAFLSILGGGEVGAALDGLYNSLILLPLVPIMALSLLYSLLAVLRLLLANPASVANKKRRRKRLLGTGTVLCRTSASLLKAYVVFYVLSVLLLIFTSAARAHIDPALVGDTLTLLYLLIAQVKACGTLNALGAVLVVLALFFGTAAGNFAKTFVVRSLEKYEEK